MTMNEMHVRRMYSELLGLTQVEMIKVSPDFANYLEATFKTELLYKNTADANGVVAELKGIPMYVDDTIDGYYEIVY